MQYHTRCPSFNSRAAGLDESQYFLSNSQTGQDFTDGILVFLSTGELPGGFNSRPGPVGVAGFQKGGGKVYAESGISRILCTHRFKHVYCAGGLPLFEIDPANGVRERGVARVLFWASVPPLPTSVLGPPPFSPEMKPGFFHPRGFPSRGRRVGVPP